MTNDNGNNTPSGATTTFKVYASRTSTSGGNGGQGFSGGSWHDTGVTFTVERASAHSESVTNDAGTYFDNLAGTGAAHSVTLSGLTSGYYYNVSKSSSKWWSISSLCFFQRKRFIIRKCFWLPQWEVTSSTKQSSYNSVIGGLFSC